MEKGIIIKGIGGFYYVKTPLGTIECRARGKFRNDCIKPCVGDFVEIELIDDKTGTVVNIMPRKNSFIRPPVANVNTLVMVSALKNPEPDFLFIDKISVIAMINNVEFVLCFNKCDLTDDTEAIKEIYKNTGFKIMFTSVLENVGVEDFKGILKDREGIVAFSGFSGVGKSTLLSAITNKELETGDVSVKLKRGKHTTRHVELFEFGENSYFADTPGFSMLELPKFDESELEMYFPEFKEFLGGCKFNGCSHINERDCRIKAAVSSGLISESRYKSYQCFYEKLKSMKEWKK